MLDIPNYQGNAAVNLQTVEHHGPGLLNINGLNLARMKMVMNCLRL